MKIKQFTFRKTKRKLIFARNVLFKIVFKIKNAKFVKPLILITKKKFNFRKNKITSQNNKLESKNQEILFSYVLNVASKIKLM